MKLWNNKGFSLVELLVVITILAIISVVAYQNFWGATDKAITSRKINDVSTIETALQQYKVDKNQYPAVDLYDINTNMWGYNTGSVALPSNTLNAIIVNQEITAITSGSWGWQILGSGSLSQIWAKGTISQNTMGKQYLSKDLYDPELWDLKIQWGGTLIEKWVGRYVYGVYSKSNGSLWATNNKGWNYYNIAYTVKKEGTDTYITKIVWDYDENSCFDNKADCPKTLIWTMSWITLPNDQLFLVDKQEQGKTNSWSNLSSFSSAQINQWIPYTINF